VNQPEKEGMGANSNISKPTNKLLDYALKYYEKGFSIIPLKPRSKQPWVSWTKYKKERLPIEEVKKWFANNNNNIGIVCGSVSNNLVVIDFDSQNLYEEWYKSLPLEWQYKVETTLTVKTSRGRHVYFRIKTNDFDKLFENKEKLETKLGNAEIIYKMYVVAPPSIHPDTGIQYEIWHENEFWKNEIDIAELTLEQWKELYGTLEKFKEGVIKKEEVREIPRTTYEYSVELGNFKLKIMGKNAFLYDQNGNPVDVFPAFKLSSKSVKKEIEKKTGVDYDTVSRSIAVLLQMKNERKVEIQRKKEIPKGERELEESEILELFELYKSAYKPGNREELVGLHMSAWFIKAGIKRDSLKKIAQMLAEYDRDANKSPDWKSKLDRILYQIDYHYDNRIALGEKLKGKSGVQEILEDVLGEEKALDVIRRTEEILGVSSPFEEDSIMFTLNYAQGIFAVANIRKKITVKARFDREENKMIYQDKVVNAAPKVVEVYENPLGGTTRFRVVWVSEKRDRPIDTGIVTMPEIIDKLKLEGLIINRYLVHDVVSAIINAFIEKGRAIIKTDIEKPGFYIVNNKLTPIRIEIKEVDKEQLKNALILLNELAENWFAYAKERFATVIKWGVISPFIFARKQLGRAYQVPHPTLYGERDTGKTTMAEIATIHIWGLDSDPSKLRPEEKHVAPGSAINTEAKMGEHISIDTFPKVINEANDMFNRPSVINILKNSVEGIIARAKFVGGEYREYLALNPIIITLNPKPPVDFEGLELVPKTCYLIRFTEADILKPERKQQFEREVGPKLKTLNVIGQAVAYKMINKGDIEILKKPWLELGRELLEELYRDVGLEIPEWINLVYTPPSHEEILSEKIERIRNKLIKYINEQYARNISRIIATTESGTSIVKPEDVTIEQKFETLLNNRLIPFILPGGDKLYITSSIFDELDLDIAGLKSLAEILGWEYKEKQSIRMGNKVVNFSVVVTTKEEVIKLLKPELT